MVNQTLYIPRAPRLRRR